MRSAKINSVGMYLPDKEVTNEELSEIMNYDVDEFLSDYGVKRRFVAEEDEAPSDMAVEASREALDRGDLDPEDLDLIILTTDTPDYITPPTSPIIQHKLGAENAGTFDINAACTDETIGLAVGSQYITMDETIGNVLVTGSYGMTTWLDWTEYSESISKIMSFLFSDGAASIILSESEEEGYLSSSILSEGEYWDSYGIYMGTGRPPTKEMIEEKKHLLRFHEHGHRVPAKYNADRWPDLIKKTVNKADHEVEDLDMVLFNQLEAHIIKETMERLGLSMDETHLIMDKYGYSGSASGFMAFYDALEQGKIERGDLIAFCTSGAGFVLGSAFFRY